MASWAWPDRPSDACSATTTLRYMWPTPTTSHSSATITNTVKSCARDLPPLNDELRNVCIIIFFSLFSLFNLFIFTLRYIFMYVSEPEEVTLAMCWNASLSNTCKNGFGIRYFGLR